MNRIYPIFECVSMDVVEKTLYITNEKLDYCELVLKDVSSTLVDDLNNPVEYYGCYKCKFGYSGRLKKLDNKYF